MKRLVVEGTPEVIAQLAGLVAGELNAGITSFQVSEAEPAALAPYVAPSPVKDRLSPAVRRHLPPQSLDVIAGAVAALFEVNPGKEFTMDEIHRQVRSNSSNVDRFVREMVNDTRITRTVRHRVHYYRKGLL